MNNSIISVNEMFYSSHFDEFHLCVQELLNDNLEETERVMFNMGQYLKDSTATIYAYIIDGKVVGFIWGYGISEKRVHINYFVVLNQYRNNGIGYLLLIKLFDFYGKEYSFELLVDKNNEKAIAFYKRNGFLLNEYNEYKYKMICNSN